MIGSAKPKSAWQIETRHSIWRAKRDRCVQPNPNLPGRLKRFTFVMPISCAFGVQPNPNLPGRLKLGCGITPGVVRVSSAKPKSAWQIETGSSWFLLEQDVGVQPNPNLPGRLKQRYTHWYQFPHHVQPNPNLPGRLKRIRTGTRKNLHRAFSQTQICLAD